MDNCSIHTIGEEYNSEMISILQASPIRAGGLSLCFDKSPDLFRIPRMKYPESEHLGFFVNEQLRGFGSLGYYNALLKEQAEKVFSFYHFYLLPEARGRRIPELAVNHFFREVRKSTANFGLAITLKGNRPVESYFGRTFDDVVPPVRIVDDLVVKTILFSKRVKNHTGYSVRNAVTEDVPVIINLLREEHRKRDFGLPFSEEHFFSVLKERGLGIENYFVATDRKGAIKGVSLAWDCNAFRRTTVLNYSSGFYATLWGYKALSKVLPLAPFPVAGESFRELTITDYAVEGRDPVIMHALLCEIYYRNHNRRYHFMNWSSCGSDPLLAAAKGFWCKNIVSQMIFTSLDPGRFMMDIHLPYIDIAFI